MNKKENEKPFEFVEVDIDAEFDPQNSIGWAVKPQEPGQDEIEQMEEATLPGMDLNLGC